MAHQSLELINENAFSFDQKGFKIVDGTHHEPYANSAEILSLNLSGQRHVGQEFKVWNSGSTDVDIWHFIGGTADGDLVKKAGGSGGTGGTGGINSVVPGTNVTVDDTDPANPVVAATSLITVTKAAADALIAAGTLIPGQNYKIMGVDVALYSGTDIILKAASTNLYEQKGSGFFYNPKYTSDPGWGIWTRYMESATAFSAITGTLDYADKELVTAQNGATGNLLADGFIEWVSGDWSGATSITGGTSGATATVSGFTSPSYAIGANVIWGGKHWINVNGNVGASTDKYTLNSEWTVVSFDATNYNLVSDEIRFDYPKGKIVARKDRSNNEVSFQMSTLTYFNGGPRGNIIKQFQWGNGRDSIFHPIGCVSNKVIDSWLECINSLGSVQFNLLNDLTFIGSNIISNGGYISANILNGSVSGISSNTLSQTSYIFGNNVMGGSDGITFNIMSNGSYISGNKLNGSSGIQYLIMDASFIRFNLLDNGYVYGSKFTSKVIEQMTFEANVNNVDFSGATIIFGSYSKKVFTRQDGTPRLSYYDNTDTLQIVDVNA